MKLSKGIELKSLQDSFKITAVKCYELIDSKGRYKLNDDFESYSATLIIENLPLFTNWTVRLKKNKDDNNLFLIRTKGMFPNQPKEFNSNAPVH